MCKSFFLDFFAAAVSGISMFSSNFSNFADGALDRLRSVHVRRQIRQQWTLYLRSHRGYDFRHAHVYQKNISHR